MAGVNLLSEWGPGNARPDLLPPILSPGEMLMDFLFPPDDGDCPVVGGDEACFHQVCADLQWSTVHNFESESDCQIQFCGGERDFRTNSSCAVWPDYPRVLLPPSCTLSTLSSEPSRGCALSYDVGHIWGGPLAVDIALQKCRHNPMSLSAVSVKCAGGRPRPLPWQPVPPETMPAQGDCGYGHSWCSDREPCADPSHECVELPLPEVSAYRMDDANEVDPVSIFMGIEGFPPGRIRVEPCLDAYCRPTRYTAPSTSIRWLIWRRGVDPNWAQRASAERPDVFHVNGSLVERSSFEDPVFLNSGPYGCGLLGMLGGDNDDICASSYVTPNGFHDWEFSGEDGRLFEREIGCMASDRHVVVLVSIDSQHPKYEDPTWRPGLYVETVGGHVNGEFSRPVDVVDEGTYDETGIIGQSIRVYLGTFELVGGTADVCSASMDASNTRVQSGELAKEAVNHVRGLFGDPAYAELPEGLGYCMPSIERTGTVDEILEDETLMVLDDGALTVPGLQAGSVPLGLGGTTLDHLGMDPPYGQEMCGLLSFRELMMSVRWEFDPLFSELESNQFSLRALTSAEIEQIIMAASHATVDSHASAVDVTAELVSISVRAQLSSSLQFETGHMGAAPAMEPASAEPSSGRRLQDYSNETLDGHAFQRTQFAVSSCELGEGLEELGEGLEKAPGFVQCPGGMYCAPYNEPQYYGECIFCSSFEDIDIHSEPVDEMCQGDFDEYALLKQGILMMSTTDLPCNVADATEDNLEDCWEQFLSNRPKFDYFSVNGSTANYRLSTAMPEYYNMTRVINGWWPYDSWLNSSLFTTSVSSVTSHAETASVRAVVDFVLRSVEPPDSNQTIRTDNVMSELSMELQGQLIEYTSRPSDAGQDVYLSHISITERRITEVGLSNAELWTEGMRESGFATTAANATVPCGARWSTWGPCNEECGESGEQSRFYSIVHGPLNGGTPCETEDGAVQTQACNRVVCPVDCNGTWSDWSEDCADVCPSGTLRRTYTILVPAENGGEDCEATDGANECGISPECEVHLPPPPPPPPPSVTEEEPTEEAPQTPENLVVTGMCSGNTNNIGNDRDYQCPTGLGPGGTDDPDVPAMHMRINSATSNRTGLCGPEDVPGGEDPITCPAADSRCCEEVGLRSGIPEAGYYMSEPRITSDGVDTFSPCTPASACAGGSKGPANAADCLVSEGCTACTRGYEGYRCAKCVSIDDPELDLERHFRKDGGCEPCGESLHVGWLVLLGIIAFVAVALAADKVLSQ